jgi:hypothetical protein
MNYLTVDHTWTETVEVDGAPIERERTVRLVVGGAADLRMGMRRSLLIEEQNALWDQLREDLERQGNDQLEITAISILRLNMFPSLIAAVTKQEGFDHWPISFDLFSKVPEELGVKWEEATFKLNPHWIFKPSPQTEEELEEIRKKVMAGISELETG